MACQIVFLLILLPSITLAEVSSFSRCPQFFAGGVAPTILHDSTNNNRFQQICQCLLDQNDRPVFFYATLYDTRNKIPVYSAYQFRRADVGRCDVWYVEPQLDSGASPCMGTLTNIPAANRGQRQALNSDYEGSGYDRGHLYPVYHTHSADAMLAISTLTNAAPQDSTFNRGQWRVFEEKVASQLQSDCNTAYIVTGVVPGNQQIGNGVRVAQYYWSSFCCYRGSGTRWSSGYIGPDNNGHVEEVTVQQLETRLSNYYGPNFSIFQGTC